MEKSDIANNAISPANKQSNNRGIILPAITSLFFANSRLKEAEQEARASSQEVEKLIQSAEKNHSS